MNLLTRFNNWLIQRKAFQIQSQFDDGFGWVMTRYYHYKHPTDFIATCILDDDDWGEPMTEWSVGARAALRMLPDDED